jgi:hypothetical protein
LSRSNSAISGVENADEEMVVLGGEIRVFGDNVDNNEELPQDNGIRPCSADERENGSQLRQKTFTGNTTETVIFEDRVGNQGQATVAITRIDKVAPQALAVVYTPNTKTTGDVAVMLFMDKVVKPIEGWAGGTGMMFSKIFTNNTSEKVYFTDLAGNVGNTGIFIDWVLGSDTEFSYVGNFQTFTALKRGYYEIELRGGEGGKATTNGTWGANGGKGGYTKGVIYLNKGEQLYFYL